MKEIQIEKIFQKLKTYMETNGVSRYEDAVVALLQKNTKRAGLNYQRDQLGSLIMTKQNHLTGPKIMISAHLDEIGYMVLDILDNGQIKIESLGGIWPNIIIGTKAKLITTKGKEFIGVFGHTSIHILEQEKIRKALKTSDLFVDCGFDNKQIAIKAGVEVGNRIYLHGETFRLHNPNLVVGKAMDNRVGITIIDMLINALAKIQLPNQTYFVGSTQEEVGARGAKTAAAMIQSNIAIAIDTTASYDTYLAGIGENKISQGVALRVFDTGTMMDPKLVVYLQTLAKKHAIPVYKFVAQGGGTDAAQMQYAGHGVATITLSIPQRYLHSPLGICDLQDIKANIELLIHFLQALDAKTWAELQY